MTTEPARVMTDPESPRPRNLTIDEALRILGQVHNEAASFLEEEILDLSEKIEKLADENEELNAQIDRDSEIITDIDIGGKVILPEQIHDLAKARTCIFNGDINRGRDLLEDVLSYIDSSWRQFC